MKQYIENGNAILGIEFGSTRIKAVLIDDKGEVLAVGGFGWENSLVNGIWTYAEEEFFQGLKGAYSTLKQDVKEKYGAENIIVLVSFASSLRPAPKSCPTIMETLLPTAIYTMLNTLTMVDVIFCAATTASPR